MIYAVLWYLVVAGFTYAVIWRGVERRRVVDPTAHVPIRDGPVGELSVIVAGLLWPVIWAGGLIIELNRVARRR